MDGLQSYRVRYCGLTADRTFVRIGGVMEGVSKAHVEAQIKERAAELGCVEMIINQLMEDRS